VTPAGATRGGAEAFGFDSLAGTYEARSGLPPGVAARVARAVSEIAAGAAGEWLVEVGAGTGEVGAHLAEVWGGRYLAFDLSLAMLLGFRRRARRAAAGARLVQAEAGAGWPLGGPVRVVFCARAAHLIGAGHLAEEVRRRRGGRGIWLVVGRIERQATSVRTELRRELRRLLDERGLEARDGASSLREIVARLEGQGGSARPPRVAAVWPVGEQPRAALRAWRERPGLAGGEVPLGAKAEVLAELERWAVSRFGDLDRESAAEERYELTSIEMPGGEE